MSTVTLAQYVTHTGDTVSPSATVEANLAVAERMVEDYLRRELASAERSEEMKVWPNGLVYPKHVPVTSVQASARYEVKNEAIIKYVTPDDLVSEVVGNWSDPDDGYPHSRPTATVTYVGGWTSETMPVSIVRVVALAAQALTVPGTAPKLGVKQASVGDVSVTYANDSGSNGTEALDSLVPLASVMLYGYRWRPL